MKLTTPREFGSALDMLSHVDIGDIVVLTVVTPTGGARTEHVGRLVGTIENQRAPIEPGEGLGDAGFVEIGTTYVLVGSAAPNDVVTIPWEGAGARRAFIQKQELTA